jgi:signal transduction histidine kinase/putative methionine-R-sulfoxide reductase with GAF domain/CheY-like chemotaxis protein
MKIFSSHSSLFIKTASIGLIITAASFLFLNISSLNNRKKLDEVSKQEASDYFKSIGSASRLLADDIIKDAVAMMIDHLNSGDKPAQALRLIGDDSNRKRFDEALIVFQSTDGVGYSYPESVCEPIINNVNGLKRASLTCGDFKYSDKIYTIIWRTLQVDTANATLAIAFPTEKLYRLADKEQRIVFGGSQAPGNPLIKEIQDNLGFRFKLRSINGNTLAEVTIKTRPLSIAQSAISGWEMYALGFLPLLSFIIFGFLLYRHFESFSRHTDSIRRILKRQKPGIELFQRDYNEVKNTLPELSEIYGLIDQSLSERNQYKKSLDILGAFLTILENKGYDRNAINEIIEVLVRATGYSSGAVILFDQLNDRVEEAGKYNFKDNLLQDLTMTQVGFDFLRKSQKLGTYSFYDKFNQKSEEPWRAIFVECHQVLAVPIAFKTQAVGLLLMISLINDEAPQIPEYLIKLVSEVLAPLVYSINMEKEKLDRYDKTRILQETSLAISSTLDLPSVLQVVTGRITEYAGATFCQIFLNAPIENVMELASFHTKRQNGVSAPDADHINIAEFPKIAEAMSTKRAIILGTQEIGDCSVSEKRIFHADSVKLLTILPISHSAKSIGVVIIGEERSKLRVNMAPDKLSFVQAVVSQAASAIENARLYGFINRKVDQLTTLYDVSAVIHSDFNMKTMLDKVLAATEDYLHYSVAAIFKLEDEKGNLSTLSWNGNPSHQDSEWRSGVNHDTNSIRAALSGNSVQINDTRAEHHLRPSFTKTLSEVAVPIKIGDRIIGVFCVGSQNQCAFSELEEEFLKALSAQIAVAMERARLFDQERERGLKLNTIFEFSRKLSKSLNVQEVLKTAADSIQEAFGYQLVAVFQFEAEKHIFHIGYQAAFNGKMLPPEFTVPEDRGLLGMTVNFRKTIYSPDVHSDTNYILAVPDVRSEVCIPIIVGEKVIGVLDVESLRLDDFTSEDISTLEALADIMAVAIDNSYLFEETIQKAERLSLIDNINKAISATLDLDSFFRVVAKAVSDNAGYRWTALAVPEGEGFEFKAGYASRAAGTISAEALLDILQEKLRAVIDNVSPEFVSFSQLAGMGVHEKLQFVIDAGIRNLALFPIGDNTRAEAVMIVGSANSAGFATSELALLKDLAIHLRIAWQNAQLFKQLKTAYDQLQEAQDRIIQTEKLRALGEMSSGVVHDFNNILAVILGRIQIVSRKLNTYEDWEGCQFMAKNLELIEKAAMDGSQILKRISEFTKKKPSEKFVDLEINQIIADSIELTRPRWKEESIAKGKSIEVQFRKNNTLNTTGNPAELREVFTNLIINAVDAIPANGEISISAHLESEQIIKIIFEDNGQGMSPETRKKIFEPFFTTKGAKGTGLGLSVTYGIISRHKGTIEVESELGRGTKFTITLPLCQSTQEETGVKQIEQIKIEGKRILAVDDQEEFREILVEILGSGGHEADAAPDARTALIMLSQKKYDLVITDLGMTGISGWELADTIHQEHPGIKIIMATGWGANLDSEKLTDHHIDSLICKPFKIDEILRVVSDVFRQIKEGVLIA